MRSRVCLHVWMYTCTHYIHVRMWLRGMHAHAFVGPPSAYVWEYICHGRVTALTLASEAMPGHWLPASER